MMTGVSRTTMTVHVDFNCLADYVFVIIDNMFRFDSLAQEV